MTKGPAAAPVTVFEWSDYECPFCQRAQDVLQRLQAEFPDTVRFVFKDFPLRSHPNALPAALAARCAGAQGRYWEYHDLLFVAQPDLSRDHLIGYARRLGLDAPGFTECLDTGGTGTRSWPSSARGARPACAPPPRSSSTGARSRAPCPSRSSRRPCRTRWPTARGSSRDVQSGAEVTRTIPLPIS